MERRQPLPRRRMLKSGKILLGKHPVFLVLCGISQNPRRLSNSSDDRGHSQGLRFLICRRTRQNMQDHVA